MESVRLAFGAMATRFEIVILDADPVHAQAAAEEAKREILRVESQCNFYSPASELSKINRNAGLGPVRCSAAMMRILTACEELHQATERAFDPSVAPALAAWGLRERTAQGRIPSQAERDQLLSQIGFDAVELDSQNQTVRFADATRRLDLGGIAKGWALDEAMLLLEESGITNAFMHGGTSTAIACGADPNGNPWMVGVEDPFHFAEDRTWLMAVPLLGNALSVSGVQGKSFTDSSGEVDIEYGHVIDPMTGEAISGKRIALAQAETAATCDAWSTALLCRPGLHPTGAVAGTAMRKTDSGWILTAGSVDPEWDVSANLQLTS